MHLEKKKDLNSEILQLVEKLKFMASLMVSPKAIPELVSNEMKSSYTTEFIPAMRSTLLEQVIPVIQQASAANALNEASRCPSNTIQPFNLPVHPGRIIALKKLFRSDQASFTSQYQALAFEAVSRCDKHVIAILPTAGGKSVLFLAPPLVEKQISVVILPFISLTEDMCRRARSHQLRFAQYPLRHGDDLTQEGGRARHSLCGDRGRCGVAVHCVLDGIGLIL